MNQFNRLRKELKLSVAGFAKEFDISFSYSEKLMYGARDPGRELLERIKEKHPEIDMNIFLSKNSTESGDN
jgi:transcriptional regulator with XRE-family HTH domain